MQIDKFIKCDVIRVTHKLKRTKVFERTMLSFTIVNSKILTIKNLDSQI